MTKNLLWSLVLSTPSVSVPTPLSFRHIGNYTVSTLKKIHRKKIESIGTLLV